jgi:hypothetical protein
MLYLILFIGPSTTILSGTIAAIHPSYPPTFIGTAPGAYLEKAVGLFRLVGDTPAVIGSVVFTFIAAATCEC